MRKFAISDIHGCAQTFEALLQKISFSKSDELYLLGDYIDRGRASKKVFDIIFDLKNTGHKIQYLKGNHEQMLLDSFTNDQLRHTWLTRNGGIETLQSFGIQHIHQLPALYLDFIRELPHYIEIEGYLLVHGGFDFTIPNPLDNTEAMLWAREWYEKINLNWLGDRLIVHGHTPQPRPMLELIHQNRQALRVIDIDCGCVYQRPGMHQLCAFDLNTQTLIFQDNLD